MLVGLAEHFTLVLNLGTSLGEVRLRVIIGPAHPESVGVFGQLHNLLHLRLNKLLKVENDIVTAFSLSKYRV